MPKLLALIALVAISIVGCKKEMDADFAASGTWKWVESVPLVSPQYIPAATARPAAGEVYLLDLKINRMFTYTLNDVLLKTGTYGFQESNGRQLLRLSSDPGAYAVNLTADTLTLVSDIPGAGYSRYLRYK